MGGVRKAKSEAENAFNRAVGRNLEALRRERKVMQTEFARSLGVSAPQLYSYESGRDRLPMYLAVRAARLLQVTIVRLFPES